MAMRTVNFEVEGSGEFPYDMLRYDCCYPSSTQACSDMTRRAERRRVSLEARTDHTLGHLKKFYPTLMRWQSFGWRLVPGSVRIN